MYKYEVKLINETTNKILSVIIVADNYNECFPKILALESKYKMTSVNLVPIGVK